MQIRLGRLPRRFEWLLLERLIERTKRFRSVKSFRVKVNSPHKQVNIIVRYRSNSVNVLFCLLAGAIATSLCGCSEIIPGLNVRLSGSGEHQYKIVNDEQKGGYDVAQTAPVPAYQIIPLDPQALKMMALQRSNEFADSLPSTVPSDVPPEYQIGPGDVVYITVWDHPELTTPTGPIKDVASAAAFTTQSTQQYVQGRLVASDGTIYFPYVGAFKVSGMTTAALRIFLSDKLKGVIVNPQLDARVINFRAARVEVTGEVVTPGTVDLDDTPKGIIQAINQCGGLNLAASRRRALLVRQGKTYKVDLAGLLSGDHPVGNPLLMPGDVLHIPDQSADQVFVLGAVAKQQPFPIQQANVSLIQALSVAGGIDPARGRQTGVIVFRIPQSQSGSQEPASVYTLDLSRPEGVLLASQFSLQPRDVIFVATTAFSQYNSIITQLLPTVSTIYELNQLNVVP